MSFLAWILDYTYAFILKRECKYEGKTFVWLEFLYNHPDVENELEFQLLLFPFCLLNVQ